MISEELNLGPINDSFNSNINKQKGREGNERGANGSERGARSAIVFIMYELLF
jgi:hypothetical protein